MNGWPSRAPNPPIRAIGPSAAAGAERALAAVLFLGLAACAETGDLGRPRPSVWSDTLLPGTGAMAAHMREEPVSWAALTDDEDELRRRAWRFLMPAHERAWFERQIADLVRTRVLPPAWRQRDPGAYLAALEAAPIRSPVSRYRRLGEDVAADRALLAPLAGIAAQVIETDRARLAAIPFLDRPEPARVASAQARVAENRCLVALVRASLHDRIAGYAHALGHVFIETPDRAGIEPERALAELRATATLLDGLPVPDLPACAGGATEKITPVARALPPPPIRRREVLGK